MKKFYLIIIALVLVGLFFAIFTRYTSAPRQKHSFDLGSDQANVGSTKTEVTLTAMGDIMLSRNVAAKIKENGTDYPFQEIAPYIKADIVFANLECPITAGPIVPTGSMIFHADPGVESALKKAGFTMLSLANNHTMNYGAKGLNDTFKLLQAVGIQYVGAGKDSDEASAPVYVEKNGIKFAFLGYNDADVVPDNYFATTTTTGTNRMDVVKMQEAVKAAKKNADIVIVSLHSGTEYKTPNSHQIEFDHAAIDAGAELVIGHHPHVLQRVEKYKGKYIMYSLGNFVFDQMFSLETRQSVITKTTFTKQGLEKIEFTPVMIYDYAQPRVTTDESEKKAILDKLEVTGTLYK